MLKKSNETESYSMKGNIVYVSGNENLKNDIYSNSTFFFFRFEQGGTDNFSALTDLSQFHFASLSGSDFLFSR